MSAENPEVVETRWKKICNGPGDPLSRPEGTEPGRDVSVAVYDRGAIDIACNNLNAGNCAISDQGEEACIFTRLLDENPRSRKEAVYRGILLNPGISQIQIARGLNIDPTNTKYAVQSLKAEEIVESGPPVKQVVGRPVIPLRIVDRHRKRLE